MNLQEIKKQLETEYKYRIEMHAHTRPISPCSEVTPRELVEIYAKLGYDAIVITNHFIYQLLSALPKDEAIKTYVRGFEDAEKAGSELGIKVLLGAELRFTENINDYLLYGTDEKMLADIYDYLEKGIEFFRKNYKTENSVFVQAHPCRDGCTPADPALLDGIESFNLHPGHNGRIGVAVRLAKDSGLDITVAGSDFHHKNVGHEGVSALRTRVLPKDSYELAEILKSRDYAFEVGESAIVLP